MLFCASVYTFPVYCEPISYALHASFLSFADLSSIHYKPVFYPPLTHFMSAVNTFPIHGEPAFCSLQAHILSAANSYCLHIHTRTDPTSILTICPLEHTDEHDGLYSNGTQTIFSPPCVIHMLSELMPMPRYCGFLGSAVSTVEVLCKDSMAIGPVSV